MKLFCDNNLTISISLNLVQHGRTKRIEIEKYFIKEKLDSEHIVTTHVFTKGDSLQLDFRNSIASWK
ncbi:hypothetical protein CR513_51528, partial [Mucuna pruriens]